MAHPSGWAIARFRMVRTTTFNDAVNLNPTN